MPKPRGAAGSRSWMVNRMKKLMHNKTSFMLNKLLKVDSQSNRIKWFSSFHVYLGSKYSFSITSPLQETQEYFIILFYKIYPPQAPREMLQWRELSSEMLQRSSTVLEGEFLLFEVFYILYLSQSHQTINQIPYSKVKQHAQSKPDHWGY